MQNREGDLRIRRALLSVSDKTGLIDLARALRASGAELVATGNTAKVLLDAGMEVRGIEELSGNPEAFQGRMKTLSFNIFSGILHRRGDGVEGQRDGLELKRLGIEPIDCVVVNFYPFEAAASRPGILRKQLVEEIDVGGPALVRAAAKNSPDVLVLTSPGQYSKVIEELRLSDCVDRSSVEACAAQAWERVLEYDSAIARECGTRRKRALRYGENPHQKGVLEYDLAGPIAWGELQTSSELSYNNILDLSAAYALASDLVDIDPKSTAVVIVKHNNPCGVAMIPKSVPDAQRIALSHAWEGDPVSAFGGVLVFTDPLEEEVAHWLSDRFVEAVAAPDLIGRDHSPLHLLMAKRPNLKAVPVRRFGEIPPETMSAVPGGKLTQTSDMGVNEELRSVTKVKWPEAKRSLARFGIAACKALKSNAVVLVREIPGVPSGYQLVGAGQGQPNRVDALKLLAIPRAQDRLRGECGNCILVSDGFFPFRDTVEAAHSAGIRWIVQPGGSIKDSESIAACDEFGIAMAFTGIRHFRH